MSRLLQNYPQLTHLNHFKFGYGADFKPWRESELDQWRAEYGACGPTLLSWPDECVRAAQLIYEHAKKIAGGRIWILFSGGIDSEVTALAFLRAGVPFSCAAIRFTGGLNEHDISWAEKFCQTHSVPLTFFELDPLAFFHSGLAVDYARLSQCVSPELLAPMWLIDQLDGYAVLGSGECFLAREELSDYLPGVSAYHANIAWYLYEKEKVASWYKFFIKRGRDGAPGFFQFTPELIYSFLLDRMVLELVTNKSKGKRNSLSSKSNIYAQHWKFEPRLKYTGYELLRAPVVDLQCYLLSAVGNATQQVQTPVRDLLKGLTQETIP